MSSKMKLGWFPFHTDRWLGSSSRMSMTLEMQGAYINLLAHCWSGEGCSIPDDKRVLSHLSGGLIGQDLDKLLEDTFVSHPYIQNRYTNLALLEVWEKQSNISRQRTAAINARWKRKEVDQDQTAVEQHDTNVSVPYIQTAYGVSLSLSNNKLVSKKDLLERPDNWHQTSPKAKKITEKYKGPDRNGNSRSLIAGTDCVWLSDEEFATVIEEFSKSGLRGSFHKKAFEIVNTWLLENPSKLAGSSEHKTRLTTWGLQESLKLQRESDNATRFSGDKTAAPQGNHPSRKVFRAERRGKGDINDKLSDELNKIIGGKKK